MLEYHTFSIYNKKYIFLPEHQQAFQTNSKCLKILKNKDQQDNAKREIITSHYSKNAGEPKKTHSIVDIPQRYALFLHVANSCNARCVYCFADAGSYGKKESIMKLDTAKKALKVFIDKCPTDSANNNFVNFFGGEPLVNWKVVKESHKFALEYAKSQNKNIDFRIVTNGTLLNKDIIDYIGKNDFGVVVSIDGGKKIQNQQRPLKNGVDSFDSIDKNLKYLLNNVDDVAARGTYVNFDYPLSKIYQELFDLGFYYVDVAPDLLNLKGNDLLKLLEQIENLSPYIIEDINKYGILRYGLFRNRLASLFGKKFKKYSNNACGAGKSISAIDPSGKIFSCHRYSSEDNFVVGNVDDGYQKTWDFTKDSSSQLCKSCWNRYACPSGCFYNNYKQSGDPLKANSTWCTYSKKMTEMSISLLENISSEHLQKILGLENDFFDEH